MRIPFAAVSAEEAGQPAVAPPAGRVRRAIRRAATAIEYAFCISLIFVVCIVAIRFIGERAAELFGTSAEQVEESINQGGP